MKKVCVITLGCKVNLYESEVIFNNLQKLGFNVFSKLEFADYYIINSCAVTNMAEKKSRGIISKISKINCNAKIFVVGCSSEIHKEDYINKSNVKAVFGNKNKYDVINSIVCDAENKDISNFKSVEIEEINAKTRTRATIKIQDGCNNFCSYCIIPYTRGREVSKTLEQIEKEIEIHSNTCKEIVITGINIVNYGKDLNPRKSLVDIVKIFHKYPNIRLRFSSFEMGTISQELLEELSQLQNFCDLFHISLQSGNNEVLKQMNRHYSFEDYKKTTDLIKQYFPSALIGTDIIVGFPTETEENFSTSLDNIKQIEFGKIHIFPYSKRDGTSISKLGELNGIIVKERENKLSIIAEQMRQKFLEKNINTTNEILIERRSKGYYLGYTKNYIPLYIQTDDVLVENEIYTVTLTNLFRDGMNAKIINKKY